MSLNNNKTISNSSVKDCDLDKSRVILVGVCLYPEDIKNKILSMEELERLADTAGFVTVHKEVQNRKSYDKSFFVGRGFLEKLVELMINHNAGYLIFDNELMPMQNRNIAKVFGIDCIDRTELILNIFINHAKTQESRLQIELAQLKYQLPRLKRLWLHLDRERGSSGSVGGTSRGMGEKQIEIDKRKIREKINKIEQALLKVDTRHKTTRKRRNLFKKICLVGYTNAGKSCLFNYLTGSKVLSEDILFATLESTASNINLGFGEDVILSDTVGFISDLPHHLVASFKATLKDVQDADLLLHVIDCSDSRFKEYMEEVNKVLEQINAADIKQIMVFNKLDKIENKNFLSKIYQKAYPGSILISAKEGTNIDLLKVKIENTLFTTVTIEMIVPYDKLSYLDLIYKYGKVKHKDEFDNNVKIIADIHKEDLYHFSELEIKEFNDVIDV